MGCLLSALCRPAEVIWVIGGEMGIFTVLPLPPLQAKPKPKLTKFNREPARGIKAYRGDYLTMSRDTGG